jgi:hypothetical protein
VDLAGLPDTVREGIQRIVTGCGGRCAAHMLVYVVLPLQWSPADSCSVCAPHSPCSITMMNRTLTYESMSTDQVLQALLPAGVEVRDVGPFKYYFGFRSRMFGTGSVEVMHSLLAVRLQ